MVEALPVICRDEHLIVVHKPSGLLVHRSDLDRHATRFAVQMVRDQAGRHVHPVHRLDRGTSGLLVFAFERDVAARLSAAFEGRAVAKSYLAVVRGHPAEAGVIDHALARRHDDYEWRGSAADGTPQAALTRYRRLATAELPQQVDRYPTSRYALLALAPETGRRHQLRRHLKHIAHPIIGDATYGKGRHNRLFAELFGVRRLLLACVAMGFDHPVDGRRVELIAPLDGEFAHLVRTLGWAGALPPDWLSAARP